MASSANTGGDAVCVQSHCVRLLPDQEFLEITHATWWCEAPSRN